MSKSLYLGLSTDVVSGIFSGSPFFCVVIELIIICVFSIVLRERWMHVRKKDSNSKPLYSPQNTFEQFWISAIQYIFLTITIFIYLFLDLIFCELMQWCSYIFKWGYIFKWSLCTKGKMHCSIHYWNITFNINIRISIMQNALRYAIDVMGDQWTTKPFCSLNIWEL